MSLFTIIDKRTNAEAVIADVVQEPWAFTVRDSRRWDGWLVDENGGIALADRFGNIAYAWPAENFEIRWNLEALKQ